MLATDPQQHSPPTPLTPVCRISETLKEAVDKLNARHDGGRSAQAMRPIDSIERTLDNQLRALTDIEARTSHYDGQLSDLALSYSMPN